MRIAQTMFTTCLFLGLTTAAAFAQQPKGSGAAPAAGAGAASGAKAAPAGGGAASGAAKAAPAGGGAASGAAKAAPAGGGAGSAAAPKPPEIQMPKPPQELQDMAKAMGGTWKCSGKVNMPDGSAVDVTANVSGKLDVDKMWIHESLVQT